MSSPAIPVSCIICQRSFASEDALRFHIGADHFSLSRFRCKDCHFGAYDSAVVLQHCVEQNHSREPMDLTTSELLQPCLLMVELKVAQSLALSMNACTFEELVSMSEECFGPELLASSPTGSRSHSRMTEIPSYPSIASSAVVQEGRGLAAMPSAATLTVAQTNAAVQPPNALSSASPLNPAGAISSPALQKQSADEALHQQKNANEMRQCLVCHLNIVNVKARLDEHVKEHARSDPNTPANFSGLPYFQQMSKHYNLCFPKSAATTSASGRPSNGLSHSVSSGSALPLLTNVKQEAANANSNDNGKREMPTLKAAVLARAASGDGSSHSSSIPKRSKVESPSNSHTKPAQSSPASANTHAAEQIPQQMSTRIPTNGPSCSSNAQPFSPTAVTNKESINAKNLTVIGTGIDNADVVSDDYYSPVYEAQSRDYSSPVYGVSPESPDAANRAFLVAKSKPSEAATESSKGSLPAVQASVSQPSATSPALPTIANQATFATAAFALGTKPAFLADAGSSTLAVTSSSAAASNAASDKTPSTSSAAQVSSTPPAAVAGTDILLCDLCDEPCQKGKNVRFHVYWHLLQQGRPRFTCKAAGCAFGAAASQHVNDHVAEARQRGDAAHSELHLFFNFIDHKSVLNGENDDLADFFSGMKKKCFASSLTD